MYPTMEFESFVWDEDGCAAERTISGESFQRLIELCFAQADAFSMNSAPWTHATDLRLARALEPYRIRSFETGSWFCYASTYPPLRVNLYRAAEGAKAAILRYIGHLFLYGDKNAEFCSLEDLCFFRDGELFFGTVTHERICFAHILSDEFGTALGELGPWTNAADGSFTHIFLSQFSSNPTL